MSRFCQNLYAKGYATGKKDAEGLTEREIRETILFVKGIGEKKADNIMQAIIAADGEKRSGSSMKFWEETGYVYDGAET